MSYGAITLEDRVAALEQQYRIPLDNLQPNVYAVGPDGTITADFKGTVTALGLILPAGVSQNASQSLLKWTRGADGASIADLQAFPDAIATSLITLLLEARSPDNQDSQVEIAAGPAGGSALTVYGSSGANPHIQAAAGAASATVIDGAGESSFLRLLSVRKLQLSYGTAGISWPGGSRQTNVVNVNHGLAGTPAVAAAFSTNANAAYAVVGTSATQISVQGNTFDASAPGAGTTLNVFWIALG